MPKFTLNTIRRKDNYQDSHFQNLYEKLISENAINLKDEDKVHLLKWALFFFNSEDDGIKRFGYRIIVRYSNFFRDYIPLYDVALNAGFIPVAKFIEKKFLPQEAIARSFLKSFLSAYQDTFKNGEKFLSVGQKQLMEFGRLEEKDYLIVAPTSYGKSEMMISKVANNLDKKLCIIVPTKALLAQTKRRMLENEDIVKTVGRIITHPEMYKPDDKVFVAVLTQERLLRLIHKNPEFCIDVLLIDEAHNLLDGGERGTLLMQALLFLKHRNDSINLKFYTPFLANSKNIETPYSDYKLEFCHTREFIKIEKYYLYDILGENKFSLYDQFLNEYFQIGTLDYDEVGFIQKHKACKNIVYLNKPRKVEEVAMLLAEHSNEVNFSDDVDEEFKDAYEAISDFLHPDYKLLSCIKKGVIYHHGKMPDIIRLYVERIFSKHSGFSFIVTSSTLLEGVNIPAEKLFLLDVKKGRQLLRRSAFKNLVGRVCRFSEVFSDFNNDLKMLEPEIYIVNGQYISENFSVKTFFNKQIKWQDESKDQDDIDNILLKKECDRESQKELARKNIEYIENIEVGTIDNKKNNFEIRYVFSDIAKACFKNNIHDFDIHENESVIINNLSRFRKDEKISNIQELLDAINSIFITNVRREKSDDFSRLRNLPARRFYSLILSWKMKGASFKEMINSILRHWKEKQKAAKSPEDHIIYVGHSWGEVKRDTDDHMEMYIDLRDKKPSQRVNIAIIRIKEEQDFVDYRLMRYIDVLNDLSMLDADFYDRIKYGSSDKKVICLLKNGISNELAKCLLNGKYDKYLNFDLSKDSINIKKDVISEMNAKNENKILIFEIKFHVS